jgi:DNA-binding transcriptional MerR regulator
MSAGLVSIGEVLARLREEFPDVTISKLRFLEAEGLVEPRRTPAGYRKYGPSDIDRLRYVLTAQRDSFLPLRVIRERLAAMDRGDAPPADPRESAVTGATDAARPAVAPVQPNARTQTVSAPTDAPLPRARFSRHEVLERSGLPDEMLTELESTGLLGARTQGWYDSDALAVAQVTAAFAGYGLAPRHLRAYRAGADREVGMFAQLLTPLRRSTAPDARSRAAEAMQDLTELSQRLHAALVRIGLRDTLGD